jgi:hypothetical protein
MKATKRFERKVEKVVEWMKVLYGVRLGPVASLRARDGAGFFYVLATGIRSAEEKAIAQARREGAEGYLEAEYVERLGRLVR